jgi:hypothetical protein
MGFASLLVVLGLFSCVSDDPQNTSSGRPSSSSGASGSSGSSGASSSGSSSSSGNSSSGGTPWDGTCDSNKPFDAPAEVKEINTQQNETRARISPDGLELYFSRYVTEVESWNLLQYVRKDPLGTWSLGEPPGSLNPYEGPPGPSRAARTSSLAFVGKGEAYVSMLDTVQPTRIGFAEQRVQLPLVLWLLPTLVTELKPGADSPWFVSDPIVSGNGRLYFSQLIDTDGGAPTSGLYWVARTATTLGPATAISIGLPSKNLYAPVLTKDESLLYFASGLSDRKIYVSRRMSGAFEQVVELTTLNIGTFNEPSWISDNGCEIYFTSDRNKDSNGVPHLDIFYARRPK